MHWAAPWPTACRARLLSLPRKVMLYRLSKMDAPLKPTLQQNQHCNYHKPILVRYMCVKQLKFATAFGSHIETQLSPELRSPEYVGQLFKRMRL